MEDNELPTDTSSRRIREYRANISMDWSRDFIVKASSMPEANQKAWDIFIKKIKEDWFNIDVEREENVK